MKNSIKILNILLLLILSSCVNINSSKQKDVFLSEFFNTESVYNSLIDYYSNKSIVIIYDKEKLLVQNLKKYGINNKFINIETEKPNNKDYFVVYNFTLNKNLATIVLATSNMDYGIIYCLKRNHENEKWKIMNIIPKNSR